MDIEELAGMAIFIGIQSALELELENLVLQPLHDCVSNIRNKKCFGNNF